MGAGGGGGGVEGCVWGTFRRDALESGSKDELTPDEEPSENPLDPPAARPRRDGEHTRVHTGGRGTRAYGWGRGGGRGCRCLLSRRRENERARVHLHENNGKLYTSSRIFLQ